MNIYQKLVEVRKCVTYLKKESNGPQYNYTGSSQVLASVREKMDELGLLLIPSVTGHTLNESTVEYIEKDRNGNEKPKRTTTYFTELDMTMTWVNAEKPEEQIVCPWYGQGVDIAGEKGVGKALTYAEKYFILKQFNIPTDKDDPDAFQKKHDDDEGNKATQANTQPPKSAAPPSNAKPASDKQIGLYSMLLGEMKTLGSDMNALFDTLKANVGDYNENNPNTLSASQASKAINLLTDWKVKKKERGAS
jgi:hypothetical protein